MGKQIDTNEIVRLFEGIRGDFPHLKMRLEREHSHVDLNMDIPRQPGLTFDVNLNLQGDELHLSAGAFWLEWFPCDRPEIVVQFRDAVHGLLSGRYRIVEHYRGTRAVKAELQQPEATGWRTIGTWSTMYLPIPWRRSARVLQNQGGTHAG